MPDPIPYSNPSEYTPPAPRLFTFASGGWVLLLAFFFTLVSAALVLYPVYKTGFHRAIGDGKNPETYGFSLLNRTIPREALIASQNAKDQVRAVPEMLVETAVPEEVDLIAKNEHIRFLVPADKVIGVVINGIERAYPVRILNVHEVVNDKVGDVPIAVTWSPLCGSAVVFDRRLDGPAAAPVEIGVSGLLYNSNLICFDRRSDAKSESLWPQLGFGAIAGPAVGKSLPLIPCTLISWGEWRSAHPATRVFLGLRTLKSQYGNAQDGVNLYLATDEVRFPLNETWESSRFPQKTSIEVTSTDGKTWIAAPPPLTAPSTAATVPHYRAYAFLFAWYAQHPNDTDYSAFGR